MCMVDAVCCLLLFCVLLLFDVECGSNSFVSEAISVTMTSFQASLCDAFDSILLFTSTIIHPSYVLH